MIFMGTLYSVTHHSEREQGVSPPQNDEDVAMAAVAYFDAEETRRV
jgi:hypothetical protein